MASRWEFNPIAEVISRDGTVRDGNGKRLNRMERRKVDERVAAWDAFWNTGDTTMLKRLGLWPKDE